MPIASVVTIVSIGYIWAKLFNASLADYFPYLACGLSLWSFIAVILGEAPTAFVTAKGLAQQVNFPLTFHIYKKVVTSAIIFFHNALSFVVIALYYGVDVKLNIVTIFPALLMQFVFGLWVSLLIGTVCLRYRDIGQLITVILSIMPLLTPIYYRVDMLKEHVWVAYINPIYHLLEICRAPLLGLPTPYVSWIVVGMINLIGTIFALILFAKYRARIPYWM